MQPWPRTDAMEVRGTVRVALPNATFRVALDNGHGVLARATGAMHPHAGSIQQGDRVIVEVAPDDLVHGRITQRMNRTR
jgi:translation initiation factor IF-1